MSQLKFDILVVSTGRVEVLKSCINSILSSNLQTLHEIIVLTLESDQDTIDFLRPFKNIKIVKEKFLPLPGRSRNILASHSSSEYVLFLDDDVVVPSCYFEISIDYISKKNPDVYGCPDQSHSSSWKQACIGALLESKFMMGPTNKRHSKNSELDTMASEIDLTLCNLWFKRSLFNEENYRFPEKVRRCEENYLLEQLSHANKKLVYNPKTFVYHLRRDNLVDMFKIQMKSGFYRAVCFFEYPKTFKLFFLIPSICGLLILFLPLISIELCLLLLCTHLLMTSSIAVKQYRNYQITSILWYTPVLALLIHIGFSLGMFIGIVYQGSRKCIN